MSKIKVIWIEDKKTFIVKLLNRKLLYILNDLGYSPKVGKDEYSKYLESNDLYIYTNNPDSIQIEHLNYVLDVDLETIAKWCDDEFDSNLFLVDYNLKNHNDEGINGDEVIKNIRKHNQKAKIIFYSSELNQEQLRGKIGDLKNVDCVIRDHILENITEYLENIE